jgi:hypothetical protein
MLRILFHALAVLHLGPGIAFGLLAFGCDGVEPALGGLCGGSPMRFSVVATLVGWVVLGGLSAVWLWRGGERGARPSTESRG